MGALLAAPLAALFYLGDVLLGLPFVPYDLFDWLTRLLPGGLLTVVIEVMVDVLMALGLDVADTAKLAEQLQALLLFLFLGASLGVLLFAGGRRMLPGASRSVALGLSGLAGVVGLLATLAVNQTSTAGPLLSTIWILGTFLGFGQALSWSYERLRAAGPAAAAAEYPPAVSVVRLSRRRFLVRLGGGAAAVTVVGAGLARWIDTGATEEVTVPDEPAVPLPNAGDPLEPAPGTRPEFTPVRDHYRIDINVRAPRISEEEWRLTVNGLVERPLDLSLADIRAYPARRQFVTLACISNPVAGPLTGTTLWTGVVLSRLLADAEVRPEATHLRLTSEDGFHEVIALDLIESDERVMLTYAWNESPLTREHGFPLRVYIPDRYGMKQPKWITGLELIDEFREGYWVERGWDREAIMNATSVIDTVAVEQTFLRGGQRFVPVGGIAHAGARGISQVEVRVDDGPWEPARLRAPLSETTWVLWRYDWPFAEGEHRFTVRCREGTGRLQVEEDRGTHPSGATGLHSAEVDI